jgi:tRNA(Ile2)-agmatinylcytidine synthase
MQLVRLNPTIPYKTRGNAAVCLEVHDIPLQIAYECTRDLIMRYADFSCENTNPGLVICLSRPDPDFYHKAVTGFCTVAEAKAVAAPVAVYLEGWKNERGLIGAIAAVSAKFSDETWEMLLYRSSAQKGARYVDALSLIVADTITTPRTWDTYDMAEGVAVCVPHTPDPVLYGIRGESPFAVARAVGCITSEQPECICLFRTNQGTDAHIIDLVFDTAYDADTSTTHTSNSLPKEGCSYRMKGTVISHPLTGSGGHVRLDIEICTRGIRMCIPCMAYEPTKSFRKIIRALIPGDFVIVYGSYIKSTLNLEKIHIVSCHEESILQAPMCEKCAKRMTSNGKNKGYKCRMCGSKHLEPARSIMRRTVHPGWYEVPSIARRHLAKPLIRGNSTQH